MRTKPKPIHRTAALWLLVAVLAALLVPTSASADRTTVDFAFWFSYAQTKVYPTTLPPVGAAHATDASPAVLALSAARAEFEGRQISLRPDSTGLRDIWIDPTALQMTDASGTVHEIPASNVSVFKVWYVNVTHPSYPFKVKGIQPDPLLPMMLANGQRLGWRPNASMNPTLRGVAAGRTQPFYVLFEVPGDAAPGAYSGGLRLTCTDDAGNPATLAIPVELTVYPFSVAQRTLKTAFGFDSPRAMMKNSASGKWLGKNDLTGHPATQVTETTSYHADQVGSWLEFMSDHRVSSAGLGPAIDGPAADGTVAMRQDVLQDYLGAGKATTLDGNRLAFNTVKMPQQPPTWLKNPFASSSDISKASRYYRSLYGALGQYAAKSYVYPIDEPSSSQRSFVVKYASFIHRTIPGAKFLLTTDPKTQHDKLVKGVDIYVERLQFFFRDSAWVRKIRSAHKSVWIYSHGSAWQGQAPVYMIDRPLTGSRVQAWLAYHCNAAGILYWSVNYWRRPGSTALRDPYNDPVSGFSRVGSKSIYNNGDGSLVYPGYYPPLGLYVEGAAPVGSLRMEALRDGLEDYEYLALVRAKYGPAAASAFVNRVIGSLPKPASGKLLFPRYASGPETYESVRTGMASALSR